MSVDVIASSDLAWRVRVTLEEGGYADLQVLQAGARHRSLVNSAMIVIRALTSEGGSQQLAMERMHACFTWLSICMSSDAWRLLLSRDEHGIPMIVISSQHWLAEDHVL
ncbi:MAG TPA: hypothetical protein VH393_04365 [Ktedonobacterales bacterium]|jgi:hypothetical protein